MYLGIYTNDKSTQEYVGMNSKGVNTQFVVGFGKDEYQITHMINQDVPVKVVVDENDKDHISKNELTALGINKNKVLTRNDKLRIFKFRNV
jgi:hypothetical protein